MGKLSWSQLLNQVLKDAVSTQTSSPHLASQALVLLRMDPECGNPWQSLELRFRQEHPQGHKLIQWNKLPVASSKVEEDSGEQLVQESNVFIIMLLYLSVVKHESRFAYKAMTALEDRHQSALKKIFQVILNQAHSLTRLQLTQTMEDTHLDSSPDSSCSMDLDATPKSHRSASRFRTSGVFSNSPGSAVSSRGGDKRGAGPDSPLRQFFDSPVTKTVAKCQEIVNEQTKLTQATRVELDQEKENCYVLQVKSSFFIDFAKPATDQLKLYISGRA